ARAFASAGGAPRTLVFALFGGEELGLLGSGHYVRQPAVALAQSVAMLNFDMVGRLRDDRLIVQGADSGGGLVDVLEAAARGGVTLSQRLPGSAAARGGLRSGDVLLRVDGVAVECLEALRREVLTKKPGERVAILYLRDDETHEVTATLGVRP